MSEHLDNPSFIRPGHPHLRPSQHRGQNHTPFNTHWYMRSYQPIGGPNQLTYYIVVAFFIIRQYCSKVQAPSFAMKIPEAKPRSIRRSIARSPAALIGSNREGLTEASLYLTPLRGGDEEELVTDSLLLIKIG